MKEIIRPEYPRPQFARCSWYNLNGPWEFEMDPGTSGRERGLIEQETFRQKILIPFCPESPLSGIGYTDFMPAVWYRRTFPTPEEAKGRRTLLHFGAVDYESEVWVNGVSVGRHRGGFTPFVFDISDCLKDGENTIVVCAEDDTRGRLSPSGKQAYLYQSSGCHYTRTTGIWQTVWLECVPETYLQDFKLFPDAANGTVAIEASVSGYVPGTVLTVMASLDGKKQAESSVKVSSSTVRTMLQMKEIALWEPGSPMLYDLELTVQAPGEEADRVTSYFGLRTISFDGKKCLINGKPVFQRLVLDQGFYPDGIYTAPSDDALRRDIEISMALGFNGARMHQKVFEPRYLYWADHLGYLLWGEMPSWGLDPHLPGALGVFLGEWMEAVSRDFNAPSVIGWCPFNEVGGESGNGLRQQTLEMTYRVTKALDPTRPVIDASGGTHGETDIYDIHDYEQNEDIFAQRYRPGSELFDPMEGEQHYDGKAPTMLSEYGGIQWSGTNGGWGYGQAPKTLEEFLNRFRVLTETLLRNPDHMGFCYTQLYDVEQEQNGLYRYDRTPKFDVNEIARIVGQRAAIEDNL